MECEDKKSPAERRRIEVDQDVKIKNAAERTNGGSFSNLPSCFRQRDLVQYVPNPIKGLYSTREALPMRRGGFDRKVEAPCILEQQ